MRRFILSGFCVLSVVSSTLLLSTTVAATTLTFELDIEFSGGTPPAGTTPWATATLDDSFGGPRG